jgi:hypothetical protein
MDSDAAYSSLVSVDFFQPSAAALYAIMQA